MYFYLEGGDFLCTFRCCIEKREPFGKVPMEALPHVNIFECLKLDLDIEVFVACPPFQDEFGHSGLMLGVESNTCP